MPPVPTALIEGEPKVFPYGRTFIFPPTEEKAVKNSGRLAKAIHRVTEDGAPVTTVRGSVRAHTPRFVLATSATKGTASSRPYFARCYPRAEAETFSRVKKAGLQAR